MSRMAYPIGENEQQTRRLITQAQLYDPFTRAFFRAAGISRGMRVLELGSGVGDVTLLIAEAVGPSGSIVGVELKPAAAHTARARLQTIGWQNVEIMEGDITSVEPGGQFDAVVGRFILMWLPDPRLVLQKVVGYLRPGGIVAFQDNDFTFGILSAPRLPTLALVTATMAELQALPGPEYHMGLKMPQLYHEVGLQPPQLTLDHPLGTGPDWSGYEFITQTVDLLSPRMRQVGMVVPPELADTSTLAARIRAEAVENGAVIVLPGLVGAWSRKI